MTSFSLFETADIFTSSAAGAGVASPSSKIALEMKNNPNTTHDAVVDPIVNKVLGILNLRDETNKYLKASYPTLKQFEHFLNTSVESGKTIDKENCESKAKEPRFKRNEFEEFIILSRWSKKNQVEGKIKWENFNEGNFNTFREQAPKDDLTEVLKELGINNDKVVNTLKAKRVLTPAHFAQKPKSWYEKLCEEEPGTEVNGKQTKHLLLNGAEKSEIEKFKDWYNFHFIGYLPSDWIVSFRNDEIDPDERDLRKVLRVIGLKADAIEALKMNDILDIETLNDTSKEWKTQSQGASSSSPEQASRSNEWKDMGLTRNNAIRIINFRHWYNFYVAGKKNMKGWVAEFNREKYNNFLQRYEPGDGFRKPSPWKFWQQDNLKLSKEKQDFRDIIQKAAESGEVTEKQRYHLLEYMEKRERTSLIEEIASHHYEGVGDSTLQEDRLRELLHQDEQEAYEKDKSDLLICQKFCQFYLSALLVLVLLWAWVATTIYFIMQYSRVGKDVDVENVTGFNVTIDNVTFDNVTFSTFYQKIPEGEHPGFDYVAFIHNVLFGLVTAVVIQELGEEATEASLYYRFLPTYREQSRRQRERRILNPWPKSFNDLWQIIVTLLMWVIFWSTRIYTLVWICFGTVSLGFGAIKGIDTSNPLYTTGQTWLGVAVTIGYTYFGLNGKNVPKPEDAVGKKTPKLEDANEKIDHSNKYETVQGDIDGSDGANGRKEAASFLEVLLCNGYVLEPPVKAASTSKKKEVAKATPSPGKANEATSARNKKNSSAPTGNSTTSSTPRKKDAAEVTPDPPSFDDMKFYGHYKDEYGNTYEMYQATPDGNCLLYAVNGSNDFQKMMNTRHGAANYIELHRSHYEKLFPNIDKVINDIRKVNAPLGHEFLQVIADWTGDTVIVHVIGVDKVYTFTPSSEFESANPSKEKRFVIYNNVDHHDGLRLINTDDEIGLVGNENSDKNKSDDDDYISSKKEADEDSGQEDEEEGDGDDDLSKGEEEGDGGEDVEEEDGSDSSSGIESVTNRVKLVYEDNGGDDVEEDDDSDSDSSVSVCEL